MKTLYLDCAMGAAGDMLTAALLELFPNPEQLIDEFNHLGIPHVHFEKMTSVKCGITGTRLSVKVHGTEEGSVAEAHAHFHGHDHHHEAGRHAHAHHTLHDIDHLLSHLNLSEKVRKDVHAVYTLIAEAESKAHGVPVSEIHFHEVGNLDAVADITAACLLMDKLAPEQVIVSPIHVGSGQVRCAHGILPVPAPATAYILQGCPIYGGEIKGELCTPTGAALLKYFADDFGRMPVMKVRAIGYGMGKKDFEAANCVRAMLGETADKKDCIWELSCNVDDMTAEQMGYALECFLKAGALDAFTVPIQMKKSRPAVLLCVLCAQGKKEALLYQMFKHTSTAGIREKGVSRSVLSRSIVNVETPFGTIRKKVYSGYGVTRSKYEYEDLADIASTHNLSIEEVLKNIDG